MLSYMKSCSRERRNSLRYPQQLHFRLLRIHACPGDRALTECLQQLTARMLAS